MKSLVTGLPLNKTFFRQPTLKVAEQLIGAVLLYQNGRSRLAVEIVETEAYLGESDPASHAFNGITQRNWPMFEAESTCYVYLSYGVNYCMNVVTGPEGIGEAVLIRAGRPILGIAKMFQNRGMVFNLEEKVVKTLASGPGKLTEALGIDLSLNGASFISSKLGLTVPNGQNRHVLVEKTKRIGISKGVDFPYRFVMKDSPYVSKRLKGI